MEIGKFTCLEVSDITSLKSTRMEKGGDGKTWGYGQRLFVLETSKEKVPRLVLTEEFILALYACYIKSLATEDPEVTII